jgi:hypothetical protein
MDITARLFLKKSLGVERLSFAMPWKLFLEMKGNARESFLYRPTWKSLRFES